jgi:UDP-glucose:(heptosyl)LPS alpha-1,3-glucosyltransferase
VRVAIMIRKWGTGGGNERVAVRLATHLSSGGHAISAICQRVESPQMPDIPNVEVRRLRTYYWGASLAHVTFARAAKKHLAELRRDRAIDVAIGFNHTVEQDVYRLGGGTQAENLRLARESGARRPNPLVDKVALDLEQTRFREGAFRLLVAPSHRVKEEIVRHYAVDPGRIEVVWNGVDLSRFRPDAPPEERASLRREWGASETEPLLLFAGHSLERKGFDVAVRVARAIGVRLVYVGGAPRPKSVPEHVVWIGPRDDLAPCYRAVDALIAPSRYDPFGGVVLEAMACGLPAIASRRIGATERAQGTVLEELFIDEPEDDDRVAACARLALDALRRPLYVTASLERARHASQEEWGAQMESLLHRAAEIR